jgi:hypothetical protein
VVKSDFRIGRDAGNNRAAKLIMIVCLDILRIHWNNRMAEQTPTGHDRTAPRREPRARKPFGHYALLLFIIGALVGFAIPPALGLWLLQDMRAQAMSLPPGQAACGMPALGVLILIFVGTPINCMAQAAIGYLVGVGLDVEEG